MAPKEERNRLAGVNGGAAALPGGNVVIAGHDEAMHGAYQVHEDAVVPIRDKTEGERA
jgi:hypothetical protein